MKYSILAAVTTLLAATATGCTTWRTQPRPVEAVVPERNPPSVRIELQDGSRMVVTNPAIDGAFLIGVGKPGGERVRLNVSQIKTIWIRELDKKRTAILASGLVVVGTVAFIYRNELNLGLGYNAIF
jgi:hypothetical protein